MVIHSERGGEGGNGREGREAGEMERAGSDSGREGGRGEGMHAHFQQPRTFVLKG